MIRYIKKHFMGLSTIVLSVLLILAMFNIIERRTTVFFITSVAAIEGLVMSIKKRSEGMYFSIGLFLLVLVIGIYNYFVL